MRTAEGNHTELFAEVVAAPPTGPRGAQEEKRITSQRRKTAAHVDSENVDAHQRGCGEAYGWFEKFALSSHYHRRAQLLGKLLRITAAPSSPIISNPNDPVIVLIIVSSSRPGHEVPRVKGC